MKSKRNPRYFLTFIVLAGALLMVTQCDKGTNPPPPPPVLELLYPKGGSGQSFKVGDTVRIRWSIHDTNVVREVAIRYSVDAGKSWSGFYIGEGSFSYPKTTYLWTPAIEQVSNQFVLKIKDYFNTTPCDSSAPFIIHQ